MLSLPSCAGLDNRDKNDAGNDRPEFALPRLGTAASPPVRLLHTKTLVAKATATAVAAIKRSTEQRELVDLLRRILQNKLIIHFKHSFSIRL